VRGDDVRQDAPLVVSFAHEANVAEAEYRRPPWMSFDDELDVAPPKSPLSTSATASPARDA
jgi:hypothetical protein